MNNTSQIDGFNTSSGKVNNKSVNHPASIALYNRISRLHHFAGVSANSGEGHGLLVVNDHNYNTVVDTIKNDKIILENEFRELDSKKTTLETQLLKHMILQLLELQHAHQKSTKSHNRYEAQSGNTIPVGNINVTGIQTSAKATDDNSPSGNSPSGNSPSGNSPSGNGPSGNSPSGNSPSGNGPSGNGPSGNGPSGNGPSGNGPSGNGPSGNGPSGNGPGSNTSNTGQRSERNNQNEQNLLKNLAHILNQLNASAHAQPGYFVAVAGAGISLIYPGPGVAIFFGVGGLQLAYNNRQFIKTSMTEILNFFEENPIIKKMCLEFLRRLLLQSRRIQREYPNATRTEVAGLLMNSMADYYMPEDDEPNHTSRQRPNR